MLVPSGSLLVCFFFFNDTATTEIYTLSLHDALPISVEVKGVDEVRETIERSRNDPFCQPETGTPADTFGRIRGEHGTTASNVAKHDGYHGALAFDEHDPRAPMDAEAIRDRPLTALRAAVAA